MIKRIILVCKLAIFGRDSVNYELRLLRLAGLKKYNYRSDVSRKKSIRNHWHHLFSVKTFPFLAFSLWNGVVLTPEEHKEFHSWCGGYRMPVTPFHYYLLKLLKC